MNTVKLIGNLPPGYSYQIYYHGGIIKILGYSEDKESIAFTIESQMKVMEELK